LPDRGLATARLQYLNQPLGEFLHIAMVPIAGRGGEPTDLTVANGGAGLVLIGGDAHPNLVMPSSLSARSRRSVRKPIARPRVASALTRRSNEREQLNT
jgi:hypothetical protein